MARLAQEHQVFIGAIRFIPIDVMHSPYNGVAVPAGLVNSQVSSGLELYPTLFALMARPLPDAGLDQSPLPEVGVFARGGNIQRGHGNTPAKSGR